jgi:hypothetical protein
MTALDALVAALPAGTLPPGRLVVPAGGDTPVYWLSDGPVTEGTWARLRDRHPESGLWPLLLQGLLAEPARPWRAGEVSGPGVPVPEAGEITGLLAGCWRNYIEHDEHDVITVEQREAVTAPYGRTWPGLAPAGTIQDDPDELAGLLAEHLRGESTRLGLVAVRRSVDALAAVGWDGAVNYHPGAVLSGVFRTWVERFGVRLVAVGFDSLELSVAAPPQTEQEALPVAAEHFALCPDNIWQSGDGQLRTYARSLVDLSNWTFWWD